MNPTARAKVLVLTYTPFAREPRALKQVKFLREEHEVVTAGFGQQPIAGVRHVELPDVPAHAPGPFGRILYLILLALRWYSPLTRLSRRDQAALYLLTSEPWDIIIAHDVQTITVANKIGATRGVVADLHEYAPRQNEHSVAWRLLIAPYFRWLCRVEVAKAATVVTVSQGIVEEYRREFGIESLLIVNATPHHELRPTPVDYPIRLVHSGAAAVQRRLETMIDAVLTTAADVTLDLYLVSDGTRYLEELKVRASSSEKVRFHEPVAYSELVDELNKYDVGLSIFAPTTFNLAWCLPNKFFDFVQARLGVVVGPSPEMERFVHQYSFGEVLRDFEADSLSLALEAITPSDVTKWKEASARYAAELSSETQMKIWGEITQALLARP